MPFMKILLRGTKIKFSVKYIWTKLNNMKLQELKIRFRKNTKNIFFSNYNLVIFLEHWNSQVNITSNRTLFSHQVKEISSQSLKNEPK